MIRIAIIQFPGLNTEYETRREINRCGMRGEFFRWNESNAAAKLAKFDGFVIGGGFSYEDRGRAGIIASLDPIMKILKAEAAKGKPLLGICNGAQILVESGLIPGVDGEKLVMALARNKRMQAHDASAKPQRGSGSASPSGEVLGTGYYNAWVNLKCMAKPNSCMFTRNIAPGEILRAPIAHGEGRFTTEIPGLIEQLQSKGQMALRYCDSNGVITENFPVNPNGAMFNIAALCNPAGNVMAVMPHLERDSIASEKLFTSMRDALLSQKSGGKRIALVKKRLHHLNAKPLPLLPLPSYQPLAKSTQLFISLIITDNEAETFEMTLANLGWPKVSVKRFTHVELAYEGRVDKEKMLRKIVQSGVLLNTNKEKLVEGIEKGLFTYSLLVREKPDLLGLSKLGVIRNRLKMEEITDVRIGTLWRISIPTKSKNVAGNEWKRILGTRLFFNPHRQEAWLES